MDAVRAARDQLGLHASALVLIEAHGAGASRVIEDARVATREERLTIGALLVQIDALGPSAAVGHQFAQRLVLAAEVVTRTGALAPNAALDLRVVQALLALHVEQQRILAQLHHRSPVHALVVAAAALRVQKAKLLTTAAAAAAAATWTFRVTVGVDGPIAHLLVLTKLQTGLAQHDLVLARAAEVIRRAVVRIGKEADGVRRTADRAVELFEANVRGLLRFRLATAAAHRQRQLRLFSLRNQARTF